MYAKFNGKCRNCDGKLEKGSRIEWSRGAGAKHIQCDPNQIVKDGKSRGQLAEEWDREHKDDMSLCERVDSMMNDRDYANISEDDLFAMACQDKARNPYR